MDTSIWLICCLVDFTGISNYDDDYIMSYIKCGRYLTDLWRSTRDNVVNKHIDNIWGLKMDWRFVNSHVVEDTETGYTIQLLGGTWFQPKEIRPVAPQGMNFLQQAKLLRCGLEYVAELCHGKEATA